MIQAVILAGGLGTRMLPYTETVPKPMLPVRGRPFIEHQLELLRAAGLRRFLILIGYRGEQIEAFAGKGERYGVEIEYSREASPLGTGGALRNAAGKLDAEFMLVNGDTLLEIDYAALVRLFRRVSALALITASQAPRPGRGNLHLSRDGAVLGYSKRQPTGEHVDAGVVLLRRQVLDLIPPIGSCSLEEEAFPQLIDRHEIAAVVTDVTFFDMGTPAGLAALEAHLA